MVNFYSRKPYIGPVFLTQEMICYQDTKQTHTSLNGERSIILNPKSRMGGKNLQQRLRKGEHVLCVVALGRAKERKTYNYVLVAH